MGAQVMYTHKIIRYDIRPDWLTVTGRYGESVRELEKAPEHEAGAELALDAILSKIFTGILERVSGHFTRRKATNYYRYSWSNGKGVTVQLGSEKQGWEVITSGAFWYDFAEYSGMRKIVTDWNLKVTRFDWALTVEPAEDFETVNADVCGLLAQIAKKKDGRKLPRIGRPTPDNYLETVTGGKRKSAKFMRIYDKPYWADEARAAIRFEMEYKHVAAPAAFALWGSQDEAITADMMVFMFGNAHNFPALFDDFPLDTAYERIPSSLPRPEPDRVKYWNGNAMKGFINFAAEHPIEARRWIFEATYNKTDLWSLPYESWGDGLASDND